MCDLDRERRESGVSCVQYQPLSKEAVAVKEACVKRVREFKRKETNSSEKKSKTKELETRCSLRRSRTVVSWLESVQIN